MKPVFHRIWHRAAPGASGTASPPRPPCPAPLLSGVAFGALLAVLPLPAASQVVEAPTDPAVLPANLPPWIRGLRDDVEGILPRDRWPTARWGVLAVSLDRGDTLVAADPDEMLAPASNVKLLTSAAALDALDPDFHYTTYLLADGEVVDGVLHGDLILYGTGDPTLDDRPTGLGPSPFEAMARELLRRGIRRVNGDVVGDASLFQGPERAPGWNPDDFNDDYAARASALGFTENVLAVEVVPGRNPGSRPLLRLLPEGASAELINEARTVPGAPRSIRLLRSDPGDPIRVTGEVRAGSRGVRRTITVDDPVLHAASGLRAVLQRHGIPVVGHTVANRDAASSVVTGPRIWAPVFGRTAPQVVATHRSPPLQEILAVVNQRSHNLYADMVSMTVGRVMDGEGSFQGGARAVTAFIQRLAGVGDRVSLVDGSGLSRENQATAGAFIAVLQAMSRGPHWSAYLETLPEAGGRSLRRMGRSAAEGNLRAKTGTIKNVSALSGIVRSSEGEAVLFSILANGVPNTWQAKDLEDRIGIRLAGTLRPDIEIPTLDSLGIRGSVPSRTAQESSRR